MLPDCCDAASFPVSTVVPMDLGTVFSCVRRLAHFRRQRMLLCYCTCHWAGRWPEVKLTSSALLEQCKDYADVRSWPGRPRTNRQQI